MSIEMEKEFKTTASKKNGYDFFTNFRINKEHSHIWGVNPEDIYILSMRVSEDQETEPDWQAQEYWGWYDNEMKGFTMIYPNYCQLHTCFPYGIKAWEDIGKGKAYRLEVINYKKA